MNDVISRNEMMQIALRVSILSIATIVVVKWMMKHMDPTNAQKKKAAQKAKEMLGRLGLSQKNDLNDHEMMIASHLVDPSDITISWGSIGGLGDVIQDIKETVILPIRRKDLFDDSHLTQPPKGVLLHGPPGCGKTMIAKATAKESGCHFINLDVSILTDKWYGESQKLAAAVFSLAKKIQPCIIFIDEIDSFLRDRNIQDHEATAMMKAQFMTLWDGLNTDSSDGTVIVMGATNRPNDLDKAILRRMPASFNVKLPNAAQRLDIIKLVMERENLDPNVDLKVIAANSEGMSGSDLKEICRHASMFRVREFMKNNGSSLSLTVPSSSNESGDSSSKNKAEEKLRAITQHDLETSLEKMKKSKV